MHKRIEISDAWERDPVEVVAMSGYAKHDQTCLRNRAALVLNAGLLCVSLRPTRSELVALASLCIDLADTLNPEAELSVAEASFVGRAA